MTGVSGFTRVTNIKTIIADSYSRVVDRVTRALLQACGFRIRDGTGAEHPWVMRACSWGCYYFDFPIVRIRDGTVAGRHGRH